MGNFWEIVVGSEANAESMSEQNWAGFMSLSTQGTETRIEPNRWPDLSQLLCCYVLLRLKLDEYS